MSRPRALLPALGLVIPLAACFSLDPPAGLKVLCHADVDCPEKLVCAHPSPDAEGCCVAPEAVAASGETNTTALVCGRWCADSRLTPTSDGRCAPAFSALAAGDDTSCGLLRPEAGEAGALYCWGAAAGHVNELYRGGAVRPHLNRIAARGDLLCGLDAGDASLQCWKLSYAEGGGLLEGDARKASFTDLSMADDHVCGLTKQGAAVCLPLAAQAVVPEAPVTPPRFRSLAAGAPDDCGLDELGNVLCWPGSPMEMRSAAADALVRSSTVGCALTTGALQCWAESDAGKPLSQAVQPEEGATFAAAAVGQELVCALPQDPAKPPACWSSAATTTPELSGLGSLVVGRAHACALKSNGGAVCWGIDDAGQAPRVFPPEP